jgi:hypothetical protein
MNLVCADIRTYIGHTHTHTYIHTHDFIITDLQQSACNDILNSAVLRRQIDNLKTTAFR